MNKIYLFTLCLIVTSVFADEPVSCVYPNKQHHELVPADACGTLSDAGLLKLNKAIIDNIDWNQYGLDCAYVNGNEKYKGWYYINQQGKGLLSAFTEDNDCAPFSNGLVVGLSNGRVIFYNQALVVVKSSDYTWASGFYQGYAKVCRGELQREYDSHGEHFHYLGGTCGYIDTHFNPVVPVEFLFENTPKPIVQ